MEVHNRLRTQKEGQRGEERWKIKRGHIRGRGKLERTTEVLDSKDDSDRRNK